MWGVGAALREGENQGGGEVDLGRREGGVGWGGVGSGEGLEVEPWTEGCVYKSLDFPISSKTAVFFLATVQILK
jgi:hypothetical protein